jgi:hypothetical protein
MVLDTKAEPMEQAAIAAAISELQTPKTKKIKRKKNSPLNYWKKNSQRKEIQRECSRGELVHSEMQILCRIRAAIR